MPVKCLSVPVVLLLLLLASMSQHVQLSAFVEKSFFAKFYLRFIQANFLSF